MILKASWCHKVSVAVLFSPGLQVAVVVVRRAEPFSSIRENISKHVSEFSSLAMKYEMLFHPLDSCFFELKQHAIILIITELFSELFLWQEFLQMTLPIPPLSLPWREKQNKSKALSGTIK